MKKIILGIIISTFSLPAFADKKFEDDTGWVAGGGLGTAFISIKPVDDTSLKNTKVTTGVATVFGGYNFNPLFGIEFDLTRTANITDENTQRGAYLYGTSFTPVLRLPINNIFKFYLKGGLQYLAYTQDPSSSYSSSVRYSGANPFLGISLHAKAVHGVRFQLDYKYTKMTLEHNVSLFGYTFYSEELDLSYSTLILTSSYQF